MEMPKEFEDIFRGAELTEDEIRTLTWVTGWEHRTVENLRSAIQKAQATALSTIQAENKSLRVLAEFGNTRAKDYRVMRDRAVEAEEENKKLRAELEQVKAERDAAMEDVAAIIGDVEEIRRGYDVNNADADGAFAELCETYCANKGRFCYEECEKYHCKNFKWRGPQKED